MPEGQRIMLGSLAADTPHQLDLVPPAAVTVSAGGCSASALPLEGTCAALDKGGEGRLDFAFGARVQHNDLLPKGAGSS